MARRFYVYVYHHVGTRHEIKVFDTEEDCEAFVFELVKNDYERESHTVRIFYGEELQWEPKDIIKSVRLTGFDE